MTTWINQGMKTTWWTTNHRLLATKRMCSDTWTSNSETVASTTSTWETMTPMVIVMTMIPTSPVKMKTNGRRGRTKRVKTSRSSRKRTLSLRLLLKISKVLRRNCSLRNRASTLLYQRRWSKLKALRRSLTSKHQLEQRLREKQLSKERS